MDNSRLTEIFRSIGRRYGFDNVSAEFREFRDFDIKWEHDRRQARFMITDYLDDAPEAVMRGLAQTVFARTAGRRKEYPQQVYDWIGDRNFAIRNRERYLSRWDGISDGTCGKHRDVETAFDRLVDRGLVQDDRMMTFRWIPTTDGSLGETSTIMRTILVSDRLDSPDIPWNVFDTALYILATMMRSDMDATEVAYRNRETIGRAFGPYIELLDALAGAGFRI
ncbi:MAG: hypothetical protein Q4Q58_06230 [Thermoplasmata archaeon]|nr:hypothetical protein [Thermoplasmata archaeon]